jgi:predicted nucleic acid-binding protein
VLSLENKQIAYELCKDVDVKDTLFVAMSLEFDTWFWTGDKKLKAHLLSKGFTKIMYY